jgi:hypothetical protein
MDPAALAAAMNEPDPCALEGNEVATDLARANPVNLPELPDRQPSVFRFGQLPEDPDKTARAIPELLLRPERWLPACHSANPIRG